MWAAMKNIYINTKTNSRKKKNEKPICFVIRSHTTVKVRRQYANATTDLSISGERERGRLVGGRSHSFGIVLFGVFPFFGLPGSHLRYCKPDIKNSVGSLDKSTFMLLEKKYM